MRFLKSRKNKILFILGIAILVFAFVATPLKAQAGWADSIVGGLARIALSILGWILTKVMSVLIWVASYNGFIKSSAVSQGWAITRDIANMFFIVVLLIISFATILQVEQYNYKKWLPRLVLMALLINFSKIICGLLIDLAQVVMLTFVNAFIGITAGGLFDMLGMGKWRDLPQVDKVSQWTIAGTYFLSVIYAVIALVVVVAMTFTLVIRMVMIWIYVVLSPLAYLLSSFPGGKSYASRWWSEFTKYLIVGPILAFFMWLSFASLVDYGGVPLDDFKSYEGVTSVDGETSRPMGDAAKDMASGDTMVKFIVSIGMLLGGLMIAQEAGGLAGSAAGSAFSSIKSTAGRVARSSYKMPIKGAIGLGKASGRAVATGLSRSDGLQETLGAIGGSRVPFVRNWAASAQGGLARIASSKDEKAEKFVGSTDDKRVLERMSRGKAFMTPWEKSVQKAARKKLGYHLEGFGSQKQYISDLDKLDNKDFGKLSMEAVAELGVRGINAEDNPEFVEYLRKNKHLLRAYNYGVLNRVYENGGDLKTAGLVRLTDKDGNLSGDTGFGTRDLHYEDDIMTSGSISAGGVGMPAKVRAVYTNPKYHRFIRGDDRSRKTVFQYSKASEQAQVLQEDKATAVPSEDRNQVRGQGNLSIGSFARSQGSALAVDFDKLNLSGMDKDGADDFRNIKGVHTSNPEAIKEIFSKLGNLINQEISTLESKTNLNAYETRRVSDLKSAQERIKSSKDISSVSLLNSSAANYSRSDLKRAHIHEATHRLGVKSEPVAHKLTEAIIQTRDYGALESPEKLNEFIIKQGVSEKSESVDTIIKQEQSAQRIELEIPDVQVNVDDIKIDSASLTAFEEAGAKISEDLPKALNKAATKINFPISPSFTSSHSLSPFAHKPVNIDSLRLEIARGNKILTRFFTQSGKSEEGDKNPLVANFINESRKLASESDQESQ